MAKYSVLEASKILSLSKQAVIHRIKKGLLEGFKDDSGKWVVEIDDLEVSNEGQTVSNEESNNDPEVSNEGSNSYQMGSNDDPEVSNDDGSQQERRPRRENDDALLENNKFLQLTTASNQELVARLTKSIEDQRAHLESQKSRESKAWLASTIIFGSLSIIAISLLFFYFSDQASQIKEKSKTLRNEMKSEHQSAIKSYEDTIKSLDTKHQESIKYMDEKHQIRYQKVSNDYQIRYQEVSNDYQKKETLLKDQIDLLKTQNKEFMDLLRVSKSGNLEAGQ